jgi:hypothetical protein
MDMRDDALRRLCHLCLSKQPSRGGVNRTGGGGDRDAYRSHPEAGLVE